MTTATIQTRYGPARAELHCAEEGSAALLLGHGAGGGIDAKDLVVVTRAAHDAGVHVALVEQPYRVAGRRAPAPRRQLDDAWLTVADELAERWFDEMPMIFGGRSSGARVACRTAEAGSAVAVLCLAFPVCPPGKQEARASRQAELDAVTVPVLVVQGEQDPFGRPDPGRHHEIAMVQGNHALDTDLDAVSRVTTEWLGRVLRPLV
ncbi:alpha/beta family hydrolase [Haloechinothrix sp. LS1_15]|uniref:alpha/beta hydrolase family protein n=1 Tax=Haloechinothrix sp. LS1_15 TaxID=2652248 RepID=UPI002945D4D9|nr:alpha/beta family hydrolase [Haloechinothrix sp. LS1_15]MDV6011584.1 alpha/beta hydrolase [Haloechinothrix sp. LS1_15]